MNINFDNEERKPIVNNCLDQELELSEEGGNKDVDDGIFNEHWFIVVVAPLIFIFYVWILFPEDAIKWGEVIDTITGRELASYKYKVVIESGGEVALYLRETLYILFSVLAWVTLRRLRYIPHVFVLTGVAYLGYLWHLWTMRITGEMISGGGKGVYVPFSNGLWGDGMVSLPPGVTEYMGIYGSLWLPLGLLMFVCFAIVAWSGFDEFGGIKDIHKFDWFAIIAIISFYAVQWF